MKATNIWDVLNVATVDGGIIVRDHVVQKNPNKPKSIRDEWFCPCQKSENILPTHPTPRAVKMSASGISEIFLVKNLSFSSMNSQSNATTKPKHPM